MQTVKDKLKSFLVNNGMFPNQADAVVEAAIPRIQQLSPTYRISWASPSDDYPAQMYAVWLPTLKEEAVKWIDANLPKAWYRMVFAQ